MLKELFSSNFGEVRVIRGKSQQSSNQGQSYKSSYRNVSMDSNDLEIPTFLRRKAD